jgi:hypothetical protein
VGFFRYLATFPRPVVRFVKPNVGPAAGGTSVELIGSGFIGGGISVHFGSAAATSFTVHSEFTITAISPPGAGIVGVTVSTLGGTSASAAKQTFHYGVPIITGLSPSGGPTAGGSSVTVTGHGFGPGTTATIFNFGTTPATSVSCASTTTCTVVAPPHKAGVVTVQAKVGVKVSAKSAPAARFTYS